MSESDPFSASGSKAVAAAFPKKMLILTAFAGAVMALAFVFISDLEDLLGHGMDVIMVASLFFSVLLLVLWIGWFLLLSRWPWIWRVAAACLVVILPYGVWKLLRPVNGGDATIVRFEPIWNRREAVTADVSIQAAEVDLQTESPFDFPRFLGAAQNATVAGRGHVDEGAFGQSEVLWKQPIGRGWAGFAARNGFAVTIEQREEQECVTCYEIATGQLKWISQHKARHQDEMNLGRLGPRATPTIHDGMVYSVGALGNFVCLEGKTGAVVWQVDLNKMLDLSIITESDTDGVIIQREQNSALAWGRSGSPLIVDDMVVVPGGGPMDGTKVTLLAFDLRSGELRWKAGEEMIAYGSPSLATVAGLPQILIVAETKVMGFEPSSGREIWSFPRPGETNGAANTSQATVVDENHILTTKGYPDGGGELIELTNEGGTITPRLVWSNSRVLKTKLMSPVLYDGHSYSLSNGFLECARLTDGERIWKRRGRFGHGQLLLLEDQILLHSEYGNLFLIQATPNEYNELGSLPTIEGVCWNTLCLFENRLLVRSELEAACIQLPLTGLPVP